MFLIDLEFHKHMYMHACYIYPYAGRFHTFKIVINHTTPFTSSTKSSKGGV